MDLKFKNDLKQSNLLCIEKMCFVLNIFIKRMFY